MTTVQYGSWKIAVDIEKTKEYYSRYKIPESQANRNFEQYCRNLNVEEKAFFDSFGINPLCCEIEHIGVDKKKNFPCGGYYLVAGNYIEYPEEILLTGDEEEPDDSADPRIDIGIFSFDFQHESYICKLIPEDMPEGFICIRFWCENMKWLLSEKPEVQMYEPLHFWEIHKIIKEKIDNIKNKALLLEERKKEFDDTFGQLDITAIPMNVREIKKYKKQWIKAFSPSEADTKRIKKLCLKSSKYTPYLWHIFSYEFLSCEEKEKAEESFNNEVKSDCVIISNVDNAAYNIKNAGNLTCDVLEKFIDVTVTASDFSWTYTKTHECMCGPYFYKKK